MSGEELTEDIDLPTITEQVDEVYTERSSWIDGDDMAYSRPVTFSEIIFRDTKEDPYLKERMGNCYWKDCKTLPYEVPSTVATVLAWIAFVACLAVMIHTLMVKLKTKNLITSLNTDSKCKWSVASSAGKTGPKVVTKKPEISLTKSLYMIQDGLENRTLEAQFKALEEINPKKRQIDGMRPQNFPKNRCRNIIPYDETRVRLHTRRLGGNDYINANNIVMDIPGGKPLKYIGTQGPTLATISDFWLMVHENNVQIIVMVTPLEEGGREKCTKYYPDHGGRFDVGNGMIVLSDKQKNFKNVLIMRNLRLVSPKQERKIIHMQFIGWPDFGVPRTTDDFMGFVAEIRAQRAIHRAMDVPTVIHCSAGVGRTGCVILMDTAFSLFDTEQPILPIQLLEKMREQRPQLIQTEEQFAFVCRAILKLMDIIAEQQGGLSPRSPPGSPPSSQGAVGGVSQLQSPVKKPESPIRQIDEQSDFYVLEFSEKKREKERNEEGRGCSACHGASS